MHSTNRGIKKGNDFEKANAGLNEKEKKTNIMVFASFANNLNTFVYTVYHSSEKHMRRMRRSGSKIDGPFTGLRS